jgi:putative membrane protein
MSWIRTAFSMISFGFTMAKFFEYLSSQPGRRMALGEGSTLPRLLVLLGLVSLLVGMWEFRHVMVQLYAAEGKRRRVTPVGVIAFLVALLGVLAFVGLFVRID